jgi:hypothetical protein
MKKLGFIVLVTHLLGGAAVAQSGATYYVATNGNDNYSCSQAQSTFTPKLSLNNALRCLQAGSTLLMRGGTYSEGLVNPPIAGTSWNSKVRIAAYQGEAVWLKPPAGSTYWVIDLQGGQTFIEFDGINLDTTNATSDFNVGGLAVWGDQGSHHIRFQNAEILGNRLPGDLGTSRQGLQLFGGIGSNEILRVKIHGGGGPNAFLGMYIHSDDNIIDGVEVYDMGMTGIQIYNYGSHTPTGNIIRNSRIHDIVTGFDTRRGGILISGDNSLVYNNIIYGINADGSGSDATALNVYSGANNEVLNNTISNNRAVAIATNHPVGALIANNIAYGNDFDGVTDYGTGTILGPNDFGADPHFVNAAQGNFQLQPGSVAIDAGTAYSIVPTDFAGVQRPQGGAYDLGAYELAKVPVPPQAPTGVQVTQSAP